VETRPAFKLNAGKANYVSNLQQDVMIRNRSVGKPLLRSLLDGGASTAALWKLAASYRAVGDRERSIGDQAGTRDAFQDFVTSGRPLATATGPADDALSLAYSFARLSSVGGVRRCCLPKRFESWKGSRTHAISRPTNSNGWPNCIRHCRRNLHLPA
jgi:hypothetical protein